MDRRTAFGQRVRAVRLSLGYSQERLADLARLHRTYVGAIERGERNVSLLNIWRLAAALRVHPSLLFMDPVDRSNPNAKTTWAAGKSNEQLARRELKWTKKPKH